MILEKAAQLGAAVGKCARAAMVGALATLVAGLTVVLPAAADPVEPAPQPPAQVRGLGNSQVSEQNGAFTTTVPIEVPAFHDVTPKLALSYSSSAGDGFVGVGYSVSGFPFIEREYFQGTWRYLLDGEPLVQDYSGAYKTIRQPFDVISFNASQWTVRRPDGVTMTFSPMFDSNQVVGAFRYLLTRVADPHGNSATYNWTCPNPAPSYQVADCYPASVAYGGVTVTFDVPYTNNRPASDVPTFATGLPTLGQLQKLLQSVTVTSNGLVYRKYTLGYATSARTGRAMLSSVQVSGSASGAPVTLPATTMKWNNDATGFSRAEVSNSFGLNATLWNGGASTITGDFNGDGHEDMIVRASGLQVAYLLSGATTGGFANAVDITSQLGSYGILGPNNNLLSTTLIHTGDFNGDGTTDLLLRVPYSQVGIDYQQYHAYILTGIPNSHGPTYFNPPVDITQSTGLKPYDWASDRIIAADFNGDGRTDLFFPDLNNANDSNGAYPTYWAAVSMASSTGLGFSGSATLSNETGMQAGDWHLSTLTTLDFNGDGKSDVIAQLPVRYSGTTQLPAKAMLFSEPATGMGDAYGPFPYGTDITNKYGMTVGTWECANLIPGDFNGDGKTDVLIQQSRVVACGGPEAAGQPHLILYANGVGNTANIDPGFTKFVDVTNANGMNDDKWRNADIVTGDFNGDGKTDLLLRRAMYVTTNPTLILQSNGNGFQTPLDVTSQYGMSYQTWADTIRVGDFNGDGNDDVFVQSASMGVLARSLLTAVGAPGDSIASVSNGLGGVSSVNYVPSSTWVNTNNPPRMRTVISLTVDDGRSTDAKQVTNFSYARGAWDPVERRVLGFQYVKSANPGDPTGAYEENYYFQGAAYETGEVQEHYLRNASGGTLMQTERSLTTTTSAPWAITQEVEADTECDATCKITSKTSGFDGYGNVTSLVEQGDTSLSGDERLTTYKYVNPGLGLADYPYDIAVYKGTGAVSTNLLKETRIYYDNLTGLGSAGSTGDATKTSRWLDTNNTWISSAATYDSKGNKLTETDPLSHTNTIVWTNDGLNPVSNGGTYPLTITNAAGQTVTTQWNIQCGKKSRTIDPNGARTSWGYDGICRETLETRPDGGTTGHSYVGYGTASQDVLTSTTDGLGHAISHASYFDGLGREWQNFDNASDYVSTTYDARGLVSDTTAPYQLGEVPAITSYTYDARHRVTVKTLPGLHTQNFHYDNWTTTACDELAKPRTRTHDAYGHVVKVVEYVNSAGCGLTPPKGTGYAQYTTTIGYDLLGRQTGSTDAKGNIASTTYDSLDRVVAKSDPDMGAWSYVYDKANRLSTQTDAKAQTITSTYDVINRIVSTKNSVDSETTKFVYDTSPHYSIGRLASATRTPATGNKVVSTYDYDIMGRATGQVLAIGTRSYTAGMTYDAFGNPRTQTYPNNETLTYGYDYDSSSAGRGLPISLSSSSLTTPLVTAAIYDSRGSMTSKTLGSGVVESFTYDPARMWLTEVKAMRGTAVIHWVKLDRDARGEVKGRTNTKDPTDTWSYDYDDLRRLTTATNTGNSAWSETFTYDPINRLATSSQLGTYKYPGANGAHVHAPNFVGSVRNTYDANGNLLTSGTGSFTYDVENKPTAVNGQTATYDAAGTRVGLGTIDFVNEGYEYDQAGSAATRYYFFNGERIASSGATTPNYYLGDQLNSATTLTNSAGAVVSRQVLSPFGRRLAVSGSTNDPIALAGQRLDSTGLYTMGAREMHPALGVFTTPDPSAAADPENPQTLNVYAYANNNPINLVDPSGFAAEDPSESDSNSQSGETKTAPYNDLSFWDVSKSDDETWSLGDQIDHVRAGWAFLNGQDNSLKYAVKLGGQHVLTEDPSVTEFTLAYNPTHGGYTDTMRSVWLKLGFDNQIVKDLAAELEYQASQQSVIHWVAHSQGGLVFKNALELAEKQGMHFYANGTSVAFHSGANSIGGTDPLLDKGGIENHGYLDPYSDFVANDAGGHHLLKRTIPSLIAFPRLFFGNHSPHTWACTEGDHCQRTY